MKFHEALDNFRFKILVEEIANVTGAMSTGSANTDGKFNTIAGKDIKLGKKIRRRRELDKYEGKVFSVSNEMFEKMKEGKIRGERWNRYIDEDSETGFEIKKYSLRNPRQPVVIRNEETGELVFLRRRQTDGRLRHNK